MSTKVGGSPGSTGAAPINQSSTEEVSKTSSQTQSTAPSGPPSPAQTEKPTTSQDIAQRKGELDLAGTAKYASLQAQAPGAKPATESEILQGARNHGLKKEEVADLKAKLDGMPKQERQKELNFLKNHVLNSTNADRALRTYTELQGMKAGHTDRLTPGVIHSLTEGVGHRRSVSSRGMEGILSQDQAINSAKALTKMPLADYKQVTQMMDSAGQKNGHAVKGSDAGAERALILKAVAARQDSLSNPSITDRIRTTFGYPSKAMGEIHNYADQIRGMKRSDLIDQSTVLDIKDDGKLGALQQRFTDSCTPTSQQIAKAEADPIYARKLHQEAIHGIADNTEIGKEQKKLLEGHGGVAIPRTTGGAGGVGMWPEDTLNDNVGKLTNKNYVRNDLATLQDRKNALDRMDGLLKRGQDVPIVVAWNGGGSHSMILTDVRGSGDNRKYLLTDPYDGRTSWMSRAQMEGTNTPFIQGPPPSNGKLWVTYE
jgi:hypothetical protein